MPTLIGSVVITLIALCPEAQAATKICRYDAGPTYEVPTNPSFIVERPTLDRGFLVTAKVPQYSGNTKSATGRVFPYSVEILDDYFARVTVSAKKGQVFADPGFLGRRCKGRKFKVVDRWQQAQNAVAPEFAVATSLDTSRISLQWPDADTEEVSPTWSRVDWAYSAAELSANLCGSIMITNHNGDAHLGAKPGSQPIVLRVTRYLADGSEQEWQGYVNRRSHDSLELVPGAPIVTDPGVLGAGKDCQGAASLRSVPTNPTFVVDAWRTPRFVALTPSGVSLPLSLTVDRRRASVHVTASEGTVFNLHALPIASACPETPSLLATHDRSRDSAPSLVSVTNSFGSGSNSTFWSRITLDVSVAEGPWGRLIFDWSLTPDGFGKHSTEAMSSDLEIWSNEYGLPEDFERAYVRIAPLWANDVQGKAWNGYILRDPTTGAFSFVELLATPEASTDGPTPEHGPAVPQLTGPLAPVAAPTSKRSNSNSACAASRWSFLFGCLSLGWLLLTLGLRRFPLSDALRKSLDAWSLPQLLSVATLLLVASLSLLFAIAVGAGVAATQWVVRSR